MIGCLILASHYAQMQEIAYLSNNCAFHKTALKERRTGYQNTLKTFL